MPRLPAPRHIRIFLASPGDVVEERQAVRETLLRLNRTPLVRRHFTIEVVSWDDPEAPAPMLATLTPQQAIALALPRPSDCDFTIVIIAGRMGTPLDERKADGTLHLSGTEWEFEDAKRAGKPVLLYRRVDPPPAGERMEDMALQRQNVERFFAQFTAPNGVLLGGVTTYKTVEELTGRLRTDIESLLPIVVPADEIASDTTWIARARAAVGRWRAARLIIVCVVGLVSTILAWAAFASFSQALQQHDAPATAYVIRYVLLVLGVFVPSAMLVLTWWWLGRPSAGGA